MVHALEEQLSIHKDLAKHKREQRGDTVMRANDLELTVQTISLNLVELGSAGYGAINCDSSPFVGVHSATGEMLQNLQCYTGERIYLAPYSFAPQFSIKTYEMIKDIINSKLKLYNRYIINPSLENVFNCEIFKLEIDNDIVYVPLWHQEMLYENIIIKIQPLLPQHITIDEYNNIHT